jgi:nitrite reductase/ring-hydroxylating ferredoxin subunit
MQKKLKIVLLILMVGVLSCKKNKNQPNNNPNQVSTNVNVYIYKNTPEFFPLQVAGGWIYKSGGASGLIVYRLAQNETNGDFVVFERNCPHEGGTNPSAIVKVQADNISAKDTICGSKFYITSGAIINGPSTYPLRQYNTTYDGNVLHIFN